MPTTTDLLPVTPLVQSAGSATDLLTLQDAYQHILNAFDIQGTNVDRTKINARMAVYEAYRDLPSMHPWRFYELPCRLNTLAPYSTGTVAYVHTGGTYERQVTLSGGTFPSDAAYRRIQISGLWYDVAERKSSTVLTLTSTANPGADVAAGTTYQLARSSYSLPAGFRRMAGRVVSIQDSREIPFLDPTAWLNMRFDRQAPGSPYSYTLLSSTDELGVVEMELHPPPSAAGGIDFVYQRTPRLLHLFGGAVQSNAGTITVSGTAVTGSGTAFENIMEGAVIRFSSSGTAATGLNGTNPYAEQRVVTSVGSATALSINASLTNTYAAKGYAISDPLDASPQMLTAILQLAEVKFMRLQQKDSRLIDQRQAQFLMALAEAQNSDRRHGDMQVADVGTEQFYSSIGAVDVAP